MSSRHATKRLTLDISQKQAHFLDATAPVKGFVGGQGSGKSWVGAYDLLRRARPGRLYIVTAPTYKVLRDATCRSFADAARLFGVLLRPVSGEAFSALVRPFQGGEPAEVLFRSTENPEHLRGPNASGVWMDEASLSPHDAYQILMARLREAGELGWLTATFTPKGRTHWTFSEVFGKRPPLAHVHLTRAHTRDNPFLPEAFIHQVEQTYGGLLARQELGGEFVSVEGAEWPAEYFPDSMFFDDWPCGPDAWVAKAIGFDPSKGRDSKAGDYAAFADLAVDSDSCLWVEAELLRGWSAEALADAAVERQRRFRPHAFAVETNQFQQLFASLIRLSAQRLRAVVPVVEVNNTVNKLVRIRRLGPYLRSGKLRVRDTPGGRLLVDQLREFPLGANDDGPDAAEMALRAVEELLGAAHDEAADDEVAYA